MSADITRENLERDYDRPSLHSRALGDRKLGRLTALVDWHKETAHPKAEGLLLTDFICDLCDFDFRAKYLALYWVGA